MDKLDRAILLGAFVAGLAFLCGVLMGLRDARRMHCNAVYGHQDYRIESGRIICTAVVDQPARDQEGQ